MPSPETMLPGASRRLGLLAARISTRYVHGTTDRLSPRLQSRWALAAGGRMGRDQFAPAWWTLADTAGNEAVSPPRWPRLSAEGSAGVPRMLNFESTRCVLLVTCPLM